MLIDWETHNSTNAICFSLTQNRMYCQRHFKNALPFFFPLCLIVEYREHTWPENWTLLGGGGSSLFFGPLTNCVYSCSLREPKGGEKKLLSQTQTAPGQSSICWVSVILLRPVHISFRFTVLLQLHWPSAETQTGLPWCLHPGHALLPKMLHAHLFAVLPPFLHLGLCPSASPSTLFLRTLRPLHCFMFPSANIILYMHLLFVYGLLYER